jgi:hypothetical protein
MIPFALRKKLTLVSNSNLVDVILQLPDANKIGLADIEELLQQQPFTYKIKRLYQSGNRVELLLDTLRVELSSLDTLKTAFADIGIEFEISLTSNSRVIT